MAIWGKLIGGSIGWAFGGIIGAIIGASIGAIFDNATRDQYVARNGGQSQGYTGNNYRHRTTQNDFEICIVVLTAAIMKADGTLQRTELDYVKRFFLQQFGQEKAEMYIKMLRDILKKEINIYDVCGQINMYMDIASKRLLIQYLFGVASSDGNVDKAELNLIEVISKNLRISEADYISIKAMFVKGSSKNDYAVLEIEPTASDDEVKKAYHRMAMKHHPDKVAHLGEDAQKAAQVKFQKIKEAYDNIKAERNFT